MLSLLTWTYTAVAALMALYGVQSMIMIVLYLIRRRDSMDLSPLGDARPYITIQLPIYNERYVVPRLVKAVASMRYPRDRLEIQILDDSDDETRSVVDRYVEIYASRGVDIRAIRRFERVGFKAGALEYGLRQAKGELVAIFDADFAPPPDWLERAVQPFVADEKVGFVQTRWGHLNPDYSLLTRAQQLALDGHFLVEQVARSRSGLFMNFNGSAGIWRKTCIEDSGGWSAETLSEDMDLSFRAQMRGWKGVYLRDVVAPAELPPQLSAFKRQQFRWARGSVQALRLLAGRILRSPARWFVKLEALLHMGGYFVSPLMLLLLLLTLPMLALREQAPWPLAYASIASLGPVALYALSQREISKDGWVRRALAFPILALLGVGISWNNTLAIIGGFRKGSTQFLRTPKFRVESGDGAWHRRSYALKLDRNFWGELGLFLYSVATLWVAIAHRQFYAVPFVSLYPMGFGYTIGLGLYQQYQVMAARRESSRRAKKPFVRRSLG